MKIWSEQDSNTGVLNKNSKHPPAGDLTDYPTPLLTRDGGNKRTVDIKHAFINSEFIFCNNKNMPQWDKILRPDF